MRPSWSSSAPPRASPLAWTDFCEVPPPRARARPRMLLACRLVRPTRPIRPAAGADGPVVGGPATQKGGWRISFTPRPAPLPFRSGAMTPFPGRAGAAAHPKVKRRPPFSVPAAAPDHDYGAVGREITPARPRRRLRGECRARCPATATRRPCRRRPRPYPWGQIPRSSARPITFSRPRPCGRRWWICASGGRAWRCASTWTLRPPTGPSRGAAGAASASGGQRCRGAPRV